MTNSHYVKYPRTYHFPFSLGKTNDDKALKDCSQFEGKEVVITTKMDGECTTGYWDGYIHARSLDSGNHPSRNWVKNFLTPLLFELPNGWRICGENLYAKHSIHYRSLPSLFLAFSIWDDKNRCLSWDDTETWCGAIGIEVVPVIYRGIWNEQIAKDFGQNVDSGADASEGFVVRLAEAFDYSAFKSSVAKFVRHNHVQTDEHWMNTSIIKNELICQT